MSSPDSDRTTRPTAVTILGWTLLIIGASTAFLSLLWIAFSGPVSDAGRELAEDLGVIGAPLKFALAVGIGGLGLGLLSAWTARGLLQRRQWALTATKALVVAATIGWLAWMILFFVWMVDQSRLSADAPPPGAVVIIVGFPTVVGLGLLGAVMWLLRSGNVAHWFGHTGPSQE